MTEIPSFLKSGEIARLIPVIADSRKEQRVASVFLAALSAIPDLAETLLDSIGQRVGKRTSINSYTEVVFEDQQPELRDRPDGLLIVDRGRSTWAALIEAKIGNNSINSDQVDRYAQLARNNSIDSVITISNEFALRPDHCPVELSKPLQRKIKLFHWSWKFILTEALLLQSRAAIKDPDQAFLLRELIRFLSHDSIGVTGFTQMPPEWKDLATQVQSGAIPRKNSPEAVAVVKAWHQEIRDLALRISHDLSVNVSVKLARSHVADADLHIKDACAQLENRQHLTAALEVPDAASDIAIAADLKARSIRIGMQIAAPQDRQRTSARINWLLRQLKDATSENLFVRIIWPRRTQDTICSLEALRTDTRKVEAENAQPPRAFEVFLVTTDTRRFAGRKTFVEELESAVPAFYEQVGQHLQTWRPKPPKPSKPPEDIDKPIAEDNGGVAPKSMTPDAVAPHTTAAGNRHTALLEIPSFLKRA